MTSKVHAQSRYALGRREDVAREVDVFRARRALLHLHKVELRPVPHRVTPRPERRADPWPARGTLDARFEAPVFDTRWDCALHDRALVGDGCAATLVRLVPAPVNASR